MPHTKILGRTGCRGMLSGVALALVIPTIIGSWAASGCRPGRTEPPPMVAGEVWVDFRIREVDRENRTLIIEQLLNEPDDIVVSERIRIRGDALIVFSKMRYAQGGKQASEIRRRGRFDQIAPGQDGGLILAKNGQARFVMISEGISILPESETKPQDWPAGAGRANGGEAAAPAPPPARSEWMEAYYNWDHDAEGRPLKCLAGAHFSLQIRSSPSGEWEIHPAYDGRGSICVVNRQLGLHKTLFRLFAEPPEFGISIYTRPNEYFWAGDGSGVYLRYYEEEGIGPRFYFITVPEGEVADLGNPAFFGTGVSQQVEPLGSPLGTRDVVVLERLQEQPGVDMYTYRLCILDPHGRERQCLDEVRTAGACGEATPRAAMLVTWEYREGSPWWGTLYLDVRVYRPYPDGKWHRSATYTDVAAPHLRGDCLTMVAMHEGKPWIKQISQSGVEEFLFPAPEQVAMLRGTDFCRWDDTGQCLFFTGAKALVRHLLCRPRTKPMLTA